MATQWRQRQFFKTTFTSLMVVSSLLLAAPPPVLSFGTIASSVLGQKTEHERITRAALACAAGTKSSGDCFEPLSIAQLAGSSGTFGAVGAPDAVPFEEPAPAHCDDADFFDSAAYTPGTPYKISRDEATFVLQLCIAHLQLRFEQGKAAAKGLLDSKDRIIRSQVDLSEDSCTFSPSFKGRAKCNVFDGFGRILHGIQDFYSHSNWADTAAPPFTPDNPPGLGLSAPAPILDLRQSQSSSSFVVPNDLSTGCYDGIGTDKTPGVGKCAGRVTHNTLNKDKGTIDEVTGTTTSPTTSRGKIGANFENAVRGAIIETRRQWRDFRAELEIEYGPRHASLMICALTRDDPIKSCQGRKIAIVIDSSGSNTETDPSNLRIAAAQAFNGMLVTQAGAGPDGLPDRVTVVDFDGGARVIYPLGDPAGATFGIDSSGDTFIAGGVAVAIGELTKDPTDPTADRTGIVVLTDGEDSDISALVAQIDRAQHLGIRVAFGFLSPPANPVPAKRSVALLPREPPAQLVTAILKTGGFFSKIFSAETQRAFIDLVITHGPTNLDNAKGTNDGGPLSPGLAVSGLASGTSGPDIFTYHGLPGEQLNFTVQSVSHQSLEVVLRNVRESVEIKECFTDGQGKVQISFLVTKEADLELIISTTDVNEGVYSVSLEVSPQCDRCPCIGTRQCITTAITSSTTLIYVSTFCITTPTPTISSLSPSTPLPPSTSQTESISSPSLTTTTPLPPLRGSTTTPTPLISPPSSISPSSLCTSTTLVVPSITVKHVTICTTSWSSSITRTTSTPPSVALSTTNSASIPHRVAVASGKLQGTLASDLDNDKKESKSFRVYIALICIVAVQSAMILCGLIWWCCFGKKRHGSYTALQDEGRMKFVPEWVAPWTPRHGYSKPGDNAPSGVTAPDPETEDLPVDKSHTQ